MEGGSLLPLSFAGTLQQPLEQAREAKAAARRLTGRTPKTLPPAGILM
ncbi:MAG: hypothetical protein ABSE93_08490 [Terriglobia bacterium]